MGPAKFTETFAQLLVPILKIEEQFAQVEKLLQYYVKESNVKSLAAAQSVLNSNPNFQKKEFKKVFNEFADNIYYTDPDRANVYLGGGATPKPTQSLAYLLRNEILTSLESLQVEVDYLLREEQKNSQDIDSSDLIQYSSSCVSNMKKYLELVPPGELEAARKFLAKSP